MKYIKNSVALGVSLLTSLNVLASAGASFDGLVSEIGGWMFSANSIMEYFVAFFGVGGGFLVFFQFIQGNDQAPKNLIKLIIGIVFFVLAFNLQSIFLPAPSTP